MLLGVPKGCFGVKVHEEEEDALRAVWDEERGWG